jgi:hypothetical protein
VGRFHVGAVAPRAVFNIFYKLYSPFVDTRTRTIKIAEMRCPFSSPGRPVADKLSVSSPKNCVIRVASVLNTPRLREQVPDA